MFSLSIDQVKSGMTLAEAVYNLNGAKLLEKEMVLDDRLISSLKNAGAKRLWVTDDDQAFLSEFGPQKIYVDAVRVIENVKSCVLSGKSFSIKTVNDVAAELSEHIIFNERPFAEMVRLKHNESTVCEHMVDVCLLSIMLGKAMGMEPNMMRLLGQSALLHDLGKFLIPKDILLKPGKLNDVEVKQIQRHPQMAYDILTSISGISKYALVVAIQHHEKLDGTGYPKGLKGNQITEFSRIVTIADIYNAITREKSYRPRMRFNQVGELLWAKAGIELDRHLTSLFLRHVVSLPLRSVVKLNNGVIGVVVYQNSNHPTRPIVSTNGEMIDLSEVPALFIEDILAYESD